jgi:hypothetical protein
MTLNKDKQMAIRGSQIHDDFKNNDKYMVEDNGTYSTEYGYNFAEQNPGLAGLGAEQALVDYGADKNFFDNILSIFGIHVSNPLVPNVPEICNKLNDLSPKELYEFYRYFNTLTPDNTPMYNAIKTSLGYTKILTKASEYINGYQKTQDLHNLINDLTKKLANGSIPFAVALEAIGIIEKQSTNQDYIVKSNQR